LKNDVYVASKIISKTTFLRVTDVKEQDPEPDPLVKGGGSEDPDPYQNVTDSEHFNVVSLILLITSQANKKIFFPV
jgi:hypothetical protein